MICASCGHTLAHHGHYGPRTGDFMGTWGWIDESRCWVYVKKKRPPNGCRCKGWTGTTNPWNGTTVRADNGSGLFV